MCLSCLRSAVASWLVLEGLEEGGARNPEQASHALFALFFGELHKGNPPLRKKGRSARSCFSSSLLSARKARQTPTAGPGALLLRASLAETAETALC